MLQHRRAEETEAIEGSGSLSTLSQTKIHPLNMYPLDFISRVYTFEITDGRTIEGVLIAIDDQSNLLVTNATETYNSNSNLYHKRELGLVSIRKNTIKKVSMLRKDFNDLKPGII